MLATQPITLAEFLTLPEIDESPAWEYSYGMATQKPMGGGKHSTLQKRLVAIVDQANSRYEAFPELRCTFGDRSVVTDVVIVERDRLPLDDNDDNHDIACIYNSYVESFSRHESLSGAARILGRFPQSTGGSFGPIVNSSTRPSISRRHG